MENGNYFQTQAPNSIGGIVGIAGLQTSAQEDELSRVLREYRDAKLRFDNACLNAQAANNERMDASEALAKLSDIVQKVVEVGRFDKTQPSPVPEVPMKSYR